MLSFIYFASREESSCPDRNHRFIWCSETDSQDPIPGRPQSLIASFLPFSLFDWVFFLPASSSLRILFLRKVDILEETTPPSFSRAIDINEQLHRRYRELSYSYSAYPARLFLYPPVCSFHDTDSTPADITSASVSRPSLLVETMSTLIKIAPFNGGNTDLSESVEEYLDDVETAALSWDLTVQPGVTEATNKSKIRLFRQNLERNGDAWHWWYFVLPDSDKRDYSKIVTEFKDRYAVKASQASSLFAVQNEMLSLSQGEVEHIRDYVHRVEKLSRKIPRDMDSLFAIAFIKGMKDQERRQRVTFDLKDSPNFSFVKALTVVKFAFQEIGEPDPFRPHQKVPESEHPSPLLYTTPSLPQVNAVSKTEFPASPMLNSLTSPLITQEQFNSLMSAYEASIGRLPGNSYRPSINPPGNRRLNPRVTCFNCGQRGHYSDSCTNQPVSFLEQQQIRERIRQDRSPLDTDFRPSGPLVEPPLSGANATELRPRAIIQRQLSEKAAVTCSPASPVSCVRSCSVTTRDLGTACTIAARIPAVRTIFENALAEKRARVEEGDMESLAGQRAPKLLRRNNEPGEGSVPRRSLRTAHHPRTSGRGQEIATTVEHEDNDDADYRSGTGQQEEVLAEENEDEEDVIMVLPRSLASKKGKQRAEVAPINWMKGQTPFTIQDALDGPSPGLSITLPQLLDCSPRLRRDLAELLRSSIPRTRKKKGPIQQKRIPPANLHSAKFSFKNQVSSEASPGIEENIECLYIEAWMGDFKIPEVLVDAGAMLDLVASKLVDALQLERFPVTGLGMRLADDRLVVLRNYVWMDVVVAGVLARIKAYEVAVSQTYQLLLSRRWLKRVKAVEYHESRTLFIEGSDHVRRKVPGIPFGATGIKMEHTDLSPFCDVDDDEAEEAIETLLNELDHWEDPQQENMLAGN